MKKAENNPLGQRLANRTRRPTDFTQRSVKLRIFGLLAVLMIVLAIADKARNPKSWAWIWKLDERAQNDEEQFNNRLAPKPLRTESDPAGTFVTSTSEATPESEEDPAKGTTDSDPPFDPAKRAWDQGWKDVFGRLDADQRLLLYEMLHATQNRQALSPAKQEDAAALLETMHRHWEDYQAIAFQSVVSLEGEDQALWVDVLRRVNKRWSEDVRPSLQAVIDGRTPTEYEDRSLTEFQRTLDSLTLKQIEDDTVFLRPAEREIWLRLEGQARDASAAEMKRRSAGEISYLQLSKQPNEYRGKVVTVRGTVKHVYRTPALDNYLGVKEHIVYWVMPAGGPSAPIVVYALGTPQGFPPVLPREESGDQKIHEDVEFSGYFLKRGAYLGKDGTYSAPLVLANVPTWYPRPPSLASATSRFSIGPPWLLPAAGAAFVLAMITFCFIYYRIRRDEAEARAVVTESVLQGPTDLSNLVLKPSTHEALRQMEKGEQPL